MKILSNNDLGIDETQFQTFLKEVRDMYYRMTILDLILPLQEYSAEKFADSRDISLRTRIRKDVFISPTSYLVPLPYARAIAVGEKKYLIEKFKETSEKKEINKINQIIDKICEFELERTSVSVFIPIKFFKDIYKSFKIEFLPKSNYSDIKHPHIKVGSTQVLFLWSSNYTPFEEIFIVDNRCGTWYYKEYNESSRIKIDLKKIDEAILELIIKTTFRFEIESPKYVYCISINKN